jgi:hypothetical protein
MAITSSMIARLSTAGTNPTPMPGIRCWPADRFRDVRQDHCEGALRRLRGALPLS